MLLVRFTSSFLHSKPSSGSCMDTVSAVAFAFAVIVVLVAVVVVAIRSWLLQPTNDGIVSLSSLSLLEYRPFLPLPNLVRVFSFSRVKLGTFIGLVSLCLQRIKSVWVRSSFPPQDDKIAHEGLCDLPNHPKTAAGAFCETTTSITNSAHDVNGTDAFPGDGWNHRRTHRSIPHRSIYTDISLP